MDQVNGMIARCRHPRTQVPKEDYLGRLFQLWSAGVFFYD